MNPLILLMTAIIPIALSKYIKNKCIVYSLWGVVAAPVSTGLYSLFFLKYIGIIFVVFMPISLFFNKPAWWILVEKLEIINGNMLTLRDELLLLSLNALIWGILFYIVGCFVKKLS